MTFIKAIAVNHLAFTDLQNAPYYLLKWAVSAYETAHIVTRNRLLHGVIWRIREIKKISAVFSRAFASMGRLRYPEAVLILSKLYLFLSFLSPNRIIPPNACFEVCVRLSKRLHSFVCILSDALSRRGLLRFLKANVKLRDNRMNSFRTLMTYLGWMYFRSYPSVCFVA